MVALTPGMAGTTLLIYLVFGVAVTIYTVYLNIKQARVNNQMEQVIEVLKQIRDKNK